METKDIKSEILKKLEGLKEKILSFFFKRNAKKITSLNDKDKHLVWQEAEKGCEKLLKIQKGAGIMRYQPPLHIICWKIKPERWGYPHPWSCLPSAASPCRAEPLPQ